MKNRRTLWGALGVLAMVTLAGLVAVSCDNDGAQHDCVLHGYHVWGGWVVLYESTCMEQGTDTRTCRYCGDTDILRTPPLGCDWGDGWVVTTAGSCTEAGEETRTCQREGCENPESPETRSVIHGHVWGGWSAHTAPTCVEIGFYIRLCERVDCHLSSRRYLPSLWHDWTGWSEYTPAADGVARETRSCRRGDCDLVVYRRADNYGQCGCGHYHCMVHRECYRRGCYEDNPFTLFYHDNCHC